MSKKYRESRDQTGLGTMLIGLGTAVAALLLHLVLGLAWELIPVFGILGIVYAAWKNMKP